MSSNRPPVQWTSIAGRLLIIALKVLLAMSTFFIYPVIVPWLWRGSVAIRRERIIRHEAARYAARQAGRRRYESRYR